MPEVDWSESEEPAPVPPYISGTVAEVVNVGVTMVGDSEKTASGVPAALPVSLVRAPKRLAEVRPPVSSEATPLEYEKKP